MGSLLVELLPFAIGLAVTPAAIAATILFLASRRPLGNAIAFAAAFSVIYALLSLAVLAAAQASDEPLVSERTRDVLTLAVGLLLLGLILATLNPNVPILLAGLATIAAAGVPGGEQLAGVVFLLLGAQVGLAGPILWFVVRPAAAARGLGRAREWLARHERPVDLGVLSAFGALFTLKGVAGL